MPVSIATVPRVPGSSASLCALVLAVACAGSRTPPAAGPRPNQNSTIQQASSARSGDLSSRLQSAELQRRAGQLDNAARLLEPVADSTPLAAFYLGLVREDQGRIADARWLYQKFLATAPAAQLRDRVRDRLALLDRLELQQAVRAALARERELSSRTPEPRTIGVFPFLTTTADPQLHPLGTALAELLTTDLAQTERLRVVERTRVQELLDEMKLNESGRADPATAVRSGHLLSAGTLVQGRIEGTGSELS